jgi:hypothetical protein
VNKRSPVHKITRIKKMAMSRWQNPFYAMNDYQLNLEKSLEKKLIAAKRVKSLNYKYTGGGIVVEVDVAIYVLHYTGGGIVVEVDVAIYKLLKTAAVYLYQHYPDKDGKAEITNVTDKTRKNTNVCLLEILLQTLQVSSS